MLSITAHVNNRIIAVVDITNTTEGRLTDDQECTYSYFANEGHGGNVVHRRDEGWEMLAAKVLLEIAASKL